ncbi:MAG TPA: sigma-E factor negative regulatory protein [Gammaproteobacteria bacterium]
MNDKLLEQVSALADGELSTHEAELLLARMERDAELRDAWERYHLAGEAMRGGLARVHHHDFAAGVAAAIAEDTVPAKTTISGAAIQRALRPVAGFAVAASVAMLAVFTLQMPQQDSSLGEVVPQGDSIPVAVPRMRAEAVDFSGVRSEALQNQLRGYLLNHSEHTRSPRIRGVMPYVQIAAHDTRPVETDDGNDRDPRN